MQFITLTTMNRRFTNTITKTRRHMSGALMVFITLARGFQSITTKGQIDCTSLDPMVFITLATGLESITM